MYKMKELKNKQLVGVFKEEYISILYPGKQIIHVDVVIADTKEECIHWYKQFSEVPLDEVDKQTTGDGSLEGLLYALSVVKEIQQNLKDNEVLIAAPTDERRERAYRRLLKSGFRKSGGQYVYHK